MTQPATAPVARRARTSCGSDDAVPQIATSAEASRLAMATVRYLPKRPPTGPGDELDRSVRNRVNRNHQRRGADRGVKIESDLRQERIGYARLGLAGKPGGSQ